MTSALVLAASLAAVFVAWHACGLVPHHGVRALLRAVAVGVLCSPGVLVGHGIGVVPAPYALYLQPSIFSLAPVLIVSAVTRVVLGIFPATCNRPTSWPLRADEIFLDARVAKFALFGLVAAMPMLVATRLNRRSEAGVVALQHALLVGGAVANLTLCRFAARLRRAHVFLAPLPFAVPSLLAAAPIVAVGWYAGGVCGALAGSGRSRLASWIALGASAVFVVTTLGAARSALHAPAHVKIEGGVAGNVILAALYAAIGIAGWALLRRHGREHTRHD